MKIKTPLGIVDVDEHPLIDGKRIKTKTTMENIDPATGKVICRFYTNSEKDVHDAVGCAKKAFMEWGSLTLEERLSYITKLKREFLKEYDCLSAIETLETGKPLAMSEYGPTVFLLELDYYLSRAKEFIGEQEIKTPIAANLSFNPKRNLRIFKPKGVVGIIVPWNFPVVLSAYSLVPALIAGNTVVLKTSSKAPFCGSKIAEIFDRVLPKGVVNCIQGKGSFVGEALVDSDIDMCVFTGSIPVGSHIAKKCGEKLVPCSLELGGLDPMIILDDADLEEASSGAVFGAFINSGQMCIAAKRILVSKKVSEKFVRLVLDKVRKLRVGSGFSNVDMGPLINGIQLNRIEMFVADAVAKGAKVELGGRKIKRKGYFFEPTVLTNVKDDMLVSCEEPFGPIMPIITFSSPEEAIEIANSTKYGLGAFIWGKDIKKTKAVAKMIESGMISINDVALPLPHVPYGGLKKSGMLKENAREGIRNLCNEMVISIPLSKSSKRWWWFPLDEQSRELPKLFSRLLAGRRISKKPGVIVKLIKAYLKRFKEAKE